jgi:hypothetical protein
MNQKKGLMNRAQLPLKKPKTKQNFPSNFGNKTPYLRSPKHSHKFKLPTGFVYLTSSSVMLNPAYGSRHFSGSPLEDVLSKLVSFYFYFIIFAASVSACVLVSLEIGYVVNIILEKLWWGEDPDATYKVVRKVSHMKKWYWGVESPVTKIRPIVYTDEYMPAKDYRIRTNPPEWPGYSGRMLTFFCVGGCLVGVICGIINMADLFEKNR